MPAPTAADCLESLLRIASSDELDEEQKREALGAIAEASSDPAKMQELLQPSRKEVRPETEADLDLVEGPEEEQESATFSRADPELYAATHKFSSTQFDLAGCSQSQGRPFDKLLAMAAKIPNADLAADGREDDPHVTVKYGLHTDDSDEVRQVVQDFGPVELVLGKTSLFPNEEHDVVKVDVGGEDIRRLNKLISDSLECTDTHPEYKPHVTLAYVKPGEGQKYAGDASVDGLRLTCNVLIFSNQEKERTAILLGAPTTYAATAPSALNVLLDPYSASATAKKPESETVDEVIVPDQPEPDEEDDDEEEPDSLLELPDIHTDSDWDSGACCAMSVGRYFSVGPETLAEWRTALRTSEEWSTDPRRIEDYLDDLGLETECQVGMTLDDLTECWQKGQPVIAYTEIYGDIAPKEAKYKYGTVVVVVGHKYGYVFLFDPLASNPEEKDSLNAPGMAMVEEEDFLANWFHRTPKGGEWRRLGIVVGPRKPESEPEEEEKPTSTNGSSTVPVAPPSLSPESLDRPEVKEAVQTLLTQLGVSSEEMQPVIEEAKTLLKEQVPDLEAPTVSGDTVEPPVPVEHPWKKQFLALADRAEKGGDKESARIYRKQAAELK